MKRPPKSKTPAAGATVAGARSSNQHRGVQEQSYTEMPATAIGCFDVDMPGPLTVYVAGGVIYEIDAHLNVTVYRRLTRREVLA